MKKPEGSKSVEIVEELKTYFTRDPGLFCIMDMTGKIRDINNTWEAILGYAFGELLGKKIFEFIHLDDREATMAAMEKTRSTQSVVTLSNRFLCKDGSLRKLEWRLVQQDGLIHAGIMDLTGRNPVTYPAEREQVEEELKISKKKLIESNKLFQTVLDTIPMPIFWKNRESVFLGCNLLFALDAGKKSPAELIGDTDHNMSWHDQAELYIKDDAMIMSTGTPRINYEEPHTSSDGTPRWVRTTKVPLRDLDGNVFGVLGTYEDITERKLAEQTLFYEKERLKITLHSIGDGVISTDSTGRILLINNIAETLTGWSEGEAMGKNIREVFNVLQEQTRLPSENSLEKVIKSGVPVDLSSDKVLVSGNGSEYVIEESAAPILDKDEKARGVVLVFRDVTERKKREKQIFFLSYHDSLTGLYNRGYFEEEMRRLDIADSLPLAIIVGDVNGLKFINDVFGHMEGDRLLQSVSRIIKKSCRAGDVVARWGGDEFIVLLPKTTLKSVQRICDQITRECNRETDTAVNISISLGFAAKTYPEQYIINMIKQAEDAMYNHKLLESRSLRSSILAYIKRTLFEKSHETEEHGERLKQLCKKVGAAVGLSDVSIKELELLAVLHDIGKIAINDTILNKPSQLSAEEWTEMKRHAEIGYRIAQSVPELSQIAEYILAHHERWDGSGYPRGLKKLDIPLMSRVLTVADAYDAMISERPYRKAMKESDAIAELVRNSGTQFDPDIVSKFLKAVR